MIGYYALATVLNLRQYARQPLFLVLFFGMPIIFITQAYYTSPDAAIPLVLRESGRDALAAIGMPELHGTSMVPITVAFLSALVGLFSVADAKRGDWRLSVAGVESWPVLLARMTVLILLTGAVTAVSVGIGLPSFRPQNLPGFIVANILVALPYAGFGVLVGTFVGRVAGAYIVFIGPLLDVGLVQSPMFPRGGLDWWFKALPGWAPIELLVDTAFTPTLDRIAELQIGIAYSAAVLLLAALALQRQLRPQR